jgi:hypothetical protein
MAAHRRDHNPCGRQTGRKTAATMPLRPLCGHRAHRTAANTSEPLPARPSPCAPFARVLLLSQTYGISGRPDSNRGPHDPKSCALPGCATPRSEAVYSHDRRTRSIQVSSRARSSVRHECQHPVRRSPIAPGQAVAIGLALSTNLGRVDPYDSSPEPRDRPARAAACICAASPGSPSAGPIAASRRHSLCPWVGWAIAKPVLHPACDGIVKRGRTRPRRC